MKISPPTLSGLLDRLIERGFVERLRDDNDRRLVRVTLTTEGRKMLQILESVGQEVLVNTFDMVGEKTTRQLVAGWSAFTEALNRVLESRPALSTPPPGSALAPPEEVHP